MSTPLYEICVAMHAPHDATYASGKASGLYHRFLQLPTFHTGMFVRQVTRWFEGHVSLEATAWAISHGYTSVEFLDIHQSNDENLDVGISEHNLSELSEMLEDRQELLDEITEILKDVALVNLQLGFYIAS